jgi:hypothetical protein
MKYKNRLSALTILMAVIGMLASLLMPKAAWAYNDQLKGKLRITSFRALSNSELPSIYTPADFFLKNQLSVLLSTSGYLFNNSGNPVNLGVEIRRFDWNNSLGTFTVDFVVHYTLSLEGVSKTFITSSSATASFGQIMSGPDRSNFVMKKVAEDSVNKLQNYLELFQIPKLDTNEKLKQEVAPVPIANAQAEEVQKQPMPPAQNQNKPILPENDRLSLEASKRKCTELGFKPATEGHGKCVLQLSK